MTVKFAPHMSMSKLIGHTYLQNPPCIMQFCMHIFHAFIGVVILKINVVSTVRNKREIYSESISHIYIDPIHVMIFHYVLKLLSYCIKRGLYTGFF